MEPLSRGLRLENGLVTLLLRALQPLPHPRVEQVWARSDFARHYFRNRGCFLFLQVLRWFTSLGLARTRLWIQRAVTRFYRAGFPHSDIHGSMPACGSPRLIAACHVLRRHLPPRHPPCALSSLTIKFTQHRRQGRRRLVNFRPFAPAPRPSRRKDTSRI